MRRVLILVSVLALSGCEQGSAKAIREEAMVEKSGDRAATCDAKQNVARAMLHEESKDYAVYKNSADAYCLSYHLQQQNGTAL